MNRIAPIDFNDERCCIGCPLNTETKKLPTLHVPTEASKPQPIFLYR